MSSVSPPRRSPAPDASLPRVQVSPQLAWRLHRPLVALHAAMEVEPLWRAVRTLLRAAFAPHRVTLFLGHLGMGEARVVFTDPPIARANRWYAARGKGNPFSPYIEAHRGLRFYRFRDVLPPPAEFRRTAFYRRFASPEGWDKGVSALYWSHQEVMAMFSLYRAPDQPEFSEEEMGLLRYLYPFIGTAIQRVQRLHSERLARHSLEEFNRQLPVGLVLLEWELRTEFANSEAHRQCAVWNLGPEAARIFNVRDAFAVPGEIEQACRRLRATMLARDPKQPLPRPDDVARVVSARDGRLRAQISVLHNPDSPLAKPRFLAVLDAGPAVAPAAGADSATRLRLLRELTPREREIAQLVCDGASNAEIAQALSKSVLTIKTQLNSVFRKLGVKSRARLMALLR